MNRVFNKELYVLHKQTILMMLRFRRLTRKQLMIKTGLDCVQVNFMIFSLLKEGRIDFVNRGSVFRFKEVI